MAGSRYPLHTACAALVMAATLTGLGMVTGCASSDLQRALARPDPPSSFAAALGRGYIDLAQRPGIDDALPFARKALAARRGVHPPAERPTDWLQSGQAPLDEAREHLTALLAQDGWAAAPAPLAEAQTAYDCWLIDTWRGADGSAADCRAAFTRAMAEAERALARPDPHYNFAAIERLAAAGTSSAGPALTVLFDLNSDAVPPAARPRLARLAAALAGGQRVVVRIDGHADSVGGPTYNDALSQRRAKAVRTALIALGAPAEAVRIAAFGERRPAVPTPDETPERRNRRVEIAFE